MEAPITLYRCGAEAYYARQGVWHQQTAAAEAQLAARFGRLQNLLPGEGQYFAACAEENRRRARVNFRRAKRTVQRGLHGGIIY